MKAGQAEGVNKFMNDLNESKYKSLKKYFFFTYSENLLDKPSIETITYQNRPKTKISSMVLALKRTSMEPSKPFTPLSTCSNPKTSGSCTSSPTAISRLENKRKENTTGMLTPLTSGLVKFRKTSSTTK